MASAQSSRRNLLIFGSLIVLWRVAGPMVKEIFTDDFVFEPIPEVAEFRRIAAGRISTGTGIFLGLNDPDTAKLNPAQLSVQDDLCAALFGSEPAPRGTVLVASFSDYYCPYCRVLIPMLTDLEAASQGRIRVTWHEWPILGEASVAAAKAALAARRQGVYPAFHKRLMRSAFQATPAYLAALADSLEIDRATFLADMESPGVLAELAQSRALAKVFSFFGVPDLVVGRTVVQGAISREQLIRLIALEREAGPMQGCAAAPGKTLWR